MNIVQLEKKLSEKMKKARSAWEKGVIEYALDLTLEFDNDFDFVGSPATLKTCLNGADNWKHFSWGGCSLIYNEDIAKRLCTPSMLKQTKNGSRKPNKSEEWLDIQARALSQAYQLLCTLAKQ